MTTGAVVEEIELSISVCGEHLSRDACVNISRDGRMIGLEFDKNGIDVVVEGDPIVVDAGLLERSFDTTPALIPNGNAWGTIEQLLL